MVDHCGFGRPLDQQPQVVQDFAAWLRGEMATTADGREFVPFTDPRAATRVCGCEWCPAATEGVERLMPIVNPRGLPVKAGPRFTKRCDVHAETCRPFERWEHEIMEAR